MVKNREKTKQTKLTNNYMLMCVQNRYKLDLYRAPTRVLAYRPTLSGRAISFSVLR